MQQGVYMAYNLTIKEIENPDKSCSTCLLTAFKYMVIDENGNAWFGSDDLSVAEEYIRKHGT
jgi:hypothetical protein